MTESVECPLFPTSGTEIRVQGLRRRGPVVIAFGSGHQPTCIRQATQTVADPIRRYYRRVVLQSHSLHQKARDGVREEQQKGVCHLQFCWEPQLRPCRLLGVGGDMGGIEDELDDAVIWAQTHRIKVQEGNEAQDRPKQSRLLERGGLGHATYMDPVAMAAQRERTPPAVPDSWLKPYTSIKPTCTQLFMGARLGCAQPYAPPSRVQRTPCPTCPFGP